MISAGYAKQGVRNALSVTPRPAEALGYRAIRDVPGDRLAEPGSRTRTMLR